MPPSSVPFLYDLWQLDSGLLLQKLDSVPIQVHVQFVLKRVTWGLGFL